MVLDFANIGVAERADSRNDTIESWIASNQQPPDPLDEDILTLSSMYAQQDTVRSAMSSQLVSLARDEIDLETPTHSHFDAGHWAVLMPCEAPEYLGIARQRLGTTIPGQPQRQPPALHVTFKSTPYATNPTRRNEQTSVDDRPSCRSCEAPASLSSVHGASEQLPAPLVYANSVFEDDSCFDETIDDENSSTTPTSIFSYCSSNSFFEPPDSSETDGFAYTSGRPYGWWPPDQVVDTLVTQPRSILKSALHNSRAKSLLTESGVVIESDATGTHVIGASQFAKFPSLDCNSGETCDCVNGLLPSNNTWVPLMGINEDGSCFSDDWWGVGVEVQGSPLGESEYNMISYPPSPSFADRRLQTQNGVRITSTPNSLSARKPFGRHNPNPRRNTLSGHSSRKDEDLIRLRQAGISYRDIKVKGKFTEAESTLRGRFRTLTKDKDQRVRKPQWRTKDVRLPACTSKGRADSG